MQSATTKSPGTFVPGLFFKGIHACASNQGGTDLKEEDQCDNFNGLVSSPQIVTPASAFAGVDCGGSPEPLEKTGFPPSRE